MFNKIWHRALKSVLPSVNQWLKKTHLSHRFTQITPVFMAMSKNPVSACYAVKFMDIMISLDFPVVSIFVNPCRQAQRGCT